jgi:hypothetical protein
MPLPTTKIGHLDISRLICGSNNFYGYSHISAARDQWLRKHFTVERVLEVLKTCARLGVNAIVSGPNPALRETLRRLEDETGFHMVWMPTPFGDSLEELKAGIDECRKWGAEVCMPHTSYIEANLKIGEGEISTLREALDYIRDQGMIPGISSHRPEALGICVEQGYDVELMILPLNTLGFLCAYEVEWQARIIRQCPKPVLVIKPLAAGRISPEPGFTFVYNQIKPTDIVAVGVLSSEEMEENVAIVEAVLRGEEPKIKPQETRSKAAVKLSGR